jgi:hypothetical protein
MEVLCGEVFVVLMSPAILPVHLRFQLVPVDARTRMTQHQSTSTLMNSLESHQSCAVANLALTGPTSEQIVMIPSTRGHLQHWVVSSEQLTVLSMTFTQIARSWAVIIQLAIVSVMNMSLACPSGRAGAVAVQTRHVLRQPQKHLGLSIHHHRTLSQCHLPMNT